MADNLLPDLEKHIRVVGEQMVCCERHCQGIALDHAQGILPRSLVLETENRSEGKGAVVIGRNPAPSKEEERQFYWEHGQSYESTRAYWDREVFKHSYHQKLSDLLDKVGLTGPILWTELVKCESPSRSALPLQTCRLCGHCYLSQELLAVPSDWPLFGVSRTAYYGATYLFPVRTVIGLPHPTGSYGHFDGLLKNPKTIGAIQKICKEDDKQAVWLPDDGGLSET